jgi:SAM-dependent methyltransferase
MADAGLQADGSRRALIPGEPLGGHRGASERSTPHGDLIAVRWDDEYRHGRYAAEPPLPFVDTILGVLRQHGLGSDALGLYVGCGNGRNYLPLVDAGANVTGLDISREAIERLRERRPDARMSLLTGDFRTFRSASPFDYLIAIQVFQHGTEAEVALYFDRVVDVLRPGGLFFLRVNSARTDVYHRHTVIEANELGGFTVRYDEGPKQGLAVHFYSDDELRERTKASFELLATPRHDVVPRAFPKTGVWAQWEMIWRKD